MEERERAVLTTQVVIAMKQLQPALLDEPINRLQLSPWDQDTLALLKAVRHELERQKFALRSKSKAHKGSS